MDHQLKRLLNLVRRTGDRLVVTDPNGEDSYVLMGLEAYEKIADRAKSSDMDFFDSEDFDDDNDLMDDFYDREEGYSKGCWDCDECDGSCSTCGGNDWNEPFDPKKFEEEALKNLDLTTPDKDIWSAMPEAGSQSETWDVNKFGEAEQKIIEEKFGEAEGANTARPTDETEPVLPIIEREPEIEIAAVGATGDRPTGEPEDVAEPPVTPETPETQQKSDDFGEEQFYLEPIE